MKEVESQYNKWPYPKPILDMREAIKEGFFYDLPIKPFKKIIFPEGRDRDISKILIAGCGTNQAVFYAMLHPESEIYGIDLSKASIHHNKAMIKKYNLKNLHVEQKDIFDINYKNEFDIICSTGVIHHTKNPSEALKTLSRAGKKNCALIVAVYSLYLRYPIYYFQDIFRNLNLDQTTESLNFIKETLKNIPEKHPIRRYMTSSHDLLTDEGVIDTFLHKQDKAFDTKSLKNLIGSSGLFFQTWFDNSYHYFNTKLNTDGAIKKNDTFYSKIQNLDYWERVEIAHTLSFGLGMFMFVLRKDKKFEFMWDDIHSLDEMTEVEHRPGIELIDKANLAADFGGQISRSLTNSNLIHKFNAKEGILWSSILDTQSNSIKDIMNRANEFCSSNIINIDYDLDYAKEFFHKMWKRGFIMFGK
tara:strand:+ start:114 stop:1361 length:1248 start_codon:yes stop_codon:yes gene_type:complete